MVLQQGWLVTSGVTYMVGVQGAGSHKHRDCPHTAPTGLVECVCLEVYNSLVRFEKGWGLVLCFC